MTKLSPIAIFSYNRIDHLKKSLESLQKNTLAPQSDLYIFSDGAKNADDINKIEQIREYLKSITGFNKVNLIYSKENKGLANSIIQGVSEVLKHHDRIIVLEDDLLLSKDFVEYMTNALDYYRNSEKVFSISAYCAPINIKNYNQDVFFFRRINSWGWATWKNRWDSVDWQLKDFGEFIFDRRKRNEFDEGGKDLTMMLLKYKLGVIDSWAIRFNFACFKQKKLNLYPAKSKVLNLGIDNSGTNTRRTRKFDTNINDNKINQECFVEEDNELKKIYSRFYRPSMYRRLINLYKLNKYINRNKK